MEFTMLKQATHLKYIPRNTTHTVLQHNVSIKTDADEWIDGCVYSDGEKVYVRPYHLFNNNNWLYYKKEHSHNE